MASIRYRKHLRHMGDKVTSQVPDTITLKQGARIIGIGTRAYNSRKANGLVAPITLVNGKEAHERQEFRRWLTENASAMGWEQNDARLLAMLKKLEGNTMKFEKTLSAAVIAALSLFGSLPAHAQATNAVSVPAGTITIVVPAAGPGSARTYQRITNAGAPGSDGVAWCERISAPSIVTSAQFIAAFAPHKAGLFPLAPFGNSLGQPSTEEFGQKYIPQQATACISDGGSSGTAAAQLTIETSQ